MRWALTGLLLGAAPPVGLGFNGVLQFNVYVASLPPDAGVCGMPMLGPIALILFIGPVCGIIGAASGWIAAGIDWWAAL